MSPKKPTYNELPHALGVVQTAGVVGQVLRSNAAAFQPGDWVEGMLGWQTHALAHHSTLRKLDPTLAPPSTAIGVLGMPGRTAWFGLIESGRPKAGDVVGEIVFEETVVEGFDKLPATLQSLFTGEHRGKLLVKV